MQVNHHEMNSLALGRQQRRCATSPDVRASNIIGPDSTLLSSSPASQTTNPDSREKTSILPPVPTLYATETMTIHTLPTVDWIHMLFVLLGYIILILRFNANPTTWNLDVLIPVPY